MKLLRQGVSLLTIWIYTNSKTNKSSRIYWAIMRMPNPVSLLPKMGSGVIQIGNMSKTYLSMLNNYLVLLQACTCSNGKRQIGNPHFEGMDRNKNKMLRAFLILYEIIISVVLYYKGERVLVLQSTLTPSFKPKQRFSSLGSSGFLLRQENYEDLPSSMFFFLMEFNGDLVVPSVAKYAKYTRSVSHHNQKRRPKIKPF